MWHRICYQNNAGIPQTDVKLYREVEKKGPKQEGERETARSYGWSSRTSSSPRGR